MNPRFPRVSGEEFLRFLRDKGFVVIRVKGSHHVLRDTTGKMVVVPVHKGETLGIGLVRKILHEAGISLTDYQSYFLG